MLNWLQTKHPRLVSVASALVLLIAMLAPALPAQAAQITSRSLALSTSGASAIGVTYTFNFTVPTTTTPVKSLDVLLCTTPSSSCTSSSGTTTGASLAAQPTGLGAASGWTGTFTTNNRLQIANSANATNPTGTVGLVFSGATNPTTANTTFYARITTYSDAAWTTVLDAGTVAASTANQIIVSAIVPEALTFCTGTSGITSSSCTGATGTSVSLGVLTTSSTGTGTSQIGVTTNAGSGYNITVNGTTLTSGPSTIAALTTPTASTQGTAQFGMNLRANTVPAVGTDPSGAGLATPTANYNTPNSYTFNTANQIASNSSSDNFRLFTASYIANITPLTPAGTYSTTLTYICTATF